MCQLSCNHFGQHCMHKTCLQMYTTCQPCNCLSANAILATCESLCANHPYCKAFDGYGAICDPQTYSCARCNLKWGIFGRNWTNICPTGNDMSITQHGIISFDTWYLLPK